MPFPGFIPDRAAARRGRSLVVVVFDLDDSGRASGLRLGSEVDMGTPHFPQDDVPLETGI